MQNSKKELIPGKSAAGFNLGDDFEKISKSITQYQKWESGSNNSLNNAISNNREWLFYQTPGLSDECTLAYKQDFIRLNFDKNRILYQIFINNESEGILWGDISVGDKLSKVLSYIPLEYDDGDEMFYPTEFSAICGVAFYTGYQSLEELPDQKIIAISIHDWSLREKT